MVLFYGCLKVVLQFNFEIFKCVVMSVLLSKVSTDLLNFTK